MARLGCLVSFLALLASACGPGRPHHDHVSVTVERIRSTDFALLPCAAASPAAPCVLVVAGGKRLLFGAPPGLREAMGAGTLGSLDAVLLFSLQGPDIEGLDEVRRVGIVVDGEPRRTLAGHVDLSRTFTGREWPLASELEPETVAAAEAP